MWKIWFRKDDKNTTFGTICNGDGKDGFTDKKKAREIALNMAFANKNLEVAITNFEKTETVTFEE